MARHVEISCVNPPSGSHRAPQTTYFFKPLSMSIRIACDRVTFFRRPLINSFPEFVGNRIAKTGSRPVAGRPRFFFGITFIDFIIFLVLHKCGQQDLIYHFAVKKTAMTADNSPSRSLASANADPAPATLRRELEEAADVRSEKAEATRRACYTQIAAMMADFKAQWLS